jgi:hypothetical protein
MPQVFNEKIYFIFYAGEFTGSTIKSFLFLICNNIDNIAINPLRYLYG